MKAIQFAEFGDYSVLTPVDAAEPDLAAGDVLVKVAFAGVSPLDNTVRLGHLPPGLLKGFPIIPGNAAVGTVVDPGSSALGVGTRVAVGGIAYGIARDGSWAEYMAAAAADLSVLPDQVDDESAAALITGAGHLTALLALTEIAGFRPGQSVLAPGAGGAVGQGGVDVAKVLGAAQAITTATTAARAAQARALGYEVVDLTAETLTDGVARITGGRGVDVVLDGVAGPVTGPALAALAPGGTLVSIGYSGGPTTQIAVTDLIWKAAHVHGFSVGQFSPDTIAGAQTRLLDLVASGQLTPRIDRVFGLDDAFLAQQHLIEGSPFGRVLIAV